MSLEVKKTQDIGCVVIRVHDDVGSLINRNGSAEDADAGEAQDGAPDDVEMWDANPIIEG